MNAMLRSPLSLSVAVLALSLLPAFASAQTFADNPFTDRIAFGDPASEAAHELTADHSEVVRGAMGHKARRLDPRGGGDWRGGEVSFALKVAPDQPNYVTLRQWGEDESDDRITLFCDGKQIGYRQIGDVEPIDQGSHARMAPGRFFTTTLPLPVEMTRGKAALTCSLRASGPFWWYGNDFAHYQKPMTVPTRPIYGLYSHTDPFFPELADNGTAPARTVRPDDLSAVLGQVKARIDAAILAIWQSDKAPNQQEIDLLGRAYAVEWSRGYQAKASLRKIVAGLDNLYATYLVNPDIVYNDPATPNPSWFGLGLSGQALRIVAPRLQGELDATLPGRNGQAVRRRDAYAEMFDQALTRNLEARRLYSNQSMIKDTFGIWYDNEGLIALHSEKARSRDALLPLLYESVGLREWTGSHTPDGRATYAVNEADAKATMPKGYFELTRMGLTKELGYVGGYGEVQDWLDTLYEATRPAPGADGDAGIRAQLVKNALARSLFRYPHYDADGYRTLRLEGVIGWRDHAYPQDIVYAQRTSWDSSALRSAVLTGDAHLVGFARQMLDDNQFFSSVAEALKVGGIRQTLGLLDTPDDYDRLKALPASPYRLPMSPDAPDTVFADPEDGVVAVKNGTDILYASLYWRANYGINHLAKVHLVTPTTDRSATVYEREAFTPSGETFTRPNNPHINGYRFTVKLPGDEAIVQAQAGEVLPVAKAPDGAHFDWGQDNPWAGRADYYELRYGDYIIAMNAGTGKSYEVALPAHDRDLKDLTTGQAVAPDVRSLTVRPGETRVIYLGKRP